MYCVHSYYYENWKLSKGITKDIRKYPLKYTTIWKLHKFIQHSLQMFLTLIMLINYVIYCSFTAAATGSNATTTADKMAASTTVVKSGK